MSDNRDNVPKIRLPGFTDACDQRKLEHLQEQKRTLFHQMFV